MSDKRLVGLVRLLILCAIIMVFAAILSACGGRSIPMANSAKPAPVAAFTNPPTASHIAASLNGTRFKDDPLKASDPMRELGMTDSGTCYIGGTKYGISTFRTKAGMEQWLKIAAAYGVSPKWETSQSVVYPSISTS